MMTGLARKTSIENKHLRNCDYFAIIPSCSHFYNLNEEPCSQSKYTELKIKGFVLKYSSKR